jgi:hypothetical protein
MLAGNMKLRTFVLFVIAVIAGVIAAIYLVTSR